MKHKEWINGNKMLMETAHKTFNKQCRCISTGNQIGDCVVSTFVRPRSETECNKYVFPEEELFRYDLKLYGENVEMTEVREYLYDYCKDKGAIVYKIFFRDYQGRKMTFGYIVTDTKHNLLRKFYHNHHYKTVSVIDECALYVSN